MAAQMLEFFPWFMADEAHRISPREPTAAEVHAGFAELIAAGAGWAAAYRAAFEHERAANVQALRVPATVLRWQGSILLRHIDNLLAHELTSNVSVLVTPADPPGRYAAMTGHLQACRSTRSP